MMEGAKTMARLHHNGIKVDREYLAEAGAAVEDEAGAIADRFKSSRFWAEWCKAYGTQANLDSRPQFATVFFNRAKLAPVQGYTDKGAISCDDEALKAAGHPIGLAYLHYHRLQKIKATYLQAIARETHPDGYLRPFFNLHTTRTYRSSSDSPNFQNIPIRDATVAGYVRRALVARAADRVLVELDYSGAEVCVAACYCRDPNLIRYIRDPSADMHRDMARQLFFLGDDVPKPARQAVKGDFVFSQFYGDWWKACAANLWRTAQGLEYQGASLVQHLQANGVVGYGNPEARQPAPGTYLDHVRRVEQDFWGRRFATYAEWRRGHYEGYLRRGWYQTLTGFTVHGQADKNNVINTPIQGSAFHCLLWSIIELQRWLDRYTDPPALLVGQIHDSVLLDCRVEAVGEVVAKAKAVMTVDMPKAWPWVVVPMSADADVTPPGGSWWEKKAYVG
jgi:DNA polymerase I-like protein with 3'-5' exonuclease and polymerase domains